MAQAPALAGFEPGAWKASGPGAPRCIGSADAFIAGGRTGCRITPISSNGDRLVATWQCPGASGRTDLRRDAGGLYTVDIQGIEADLPFASRAEWRRTGGC